MGFEPISDCYFIAEVAYLYYTPQSNCTATACLPFQHPVLFLYWKISITHSEQRSELLYLSSNIKYASSCVLPWQYSAWQWANISFSILQTYINYQYSFVTSTLQNLRLRSIEIILNVNSAFNAELAPALAIDYFRFNIMVLWSKETKSYHVILATIRAVVVFGVFLHG